MIPSNDLFLKSNNYQKVIQKPQEDSKSFIAPMKSKPLLYNIAGHLLFLLSLSHECMVEFSMGLLTWYYNRSNAEADMKIQLTAFYKSDIYKNWKINKTAPLFSLRSFSREMYTNFYQSIYSNI